MGGAACGGIIRGCCSDMERPLLNDTGCITDGMGAAFCRGSLLARRGSRDKRGSLGGWMMGAVSTGGSISICKII